MSWLTYASGETVRMEKGETKAFVCESQASFPDPSMRIYLANRALTSQFTRTVQTAESGTHDALKRVVYTVRLSGNYTARQADDNGLLTCEAIVSILTPERARVKISLRGKPFNPFNIEAIFIQSTRRQTSSKGILTLSCWYSLDSSR